MENESWTRVSQGRTPRIFSWFKTKTVEQRVGQRASNKRNIFRLGCDVYWKTEQGAYWKGGS